MKNLIFSLFVCALFLGSSQTALADDRADERRQALRERSLIARQIRAADRGSDHYRYLRQKYRDISNTLKNLRRQPSTSALTVSPIAVSQAEEAPPEPQQQTSNPSRTIDEKQQLLRERRAQRLGLQPIALNVAPAAEEEVEIAVELGKASFYADFFNGRTTASGTVFSNADMTAAHKTLDFGTRVRVVHPESGNSIEVTITDRGPFVAGRVIDLTSAGFAKLAPLSRGVIDVRLEILD